MDFTILDENRVLVNEITLQNRTVIIEKDGQRISVPYSVSFDKNTGKRVVVSHPEKGYVINDKFLKQYSQYFRTVNNFATKLWPNVIIALFFVCFFWRCRRLYRKEKQVVYLPLLIPMIAWGLNALWAIIYIYNPIKDLFETDAAFPFLLIFHVNYSLLLPWFLTLATLAGIIPWLISLWRWRRKNRAMS